MRLVWVLCICFLCIPVDAFELSPMIQDMHVGAKHNSAQVLLKNTSALDIPFEIQINEIVFDATGKYQVKPANDDIIILPPAVILPAASSQVLRLQWVGDQPLTQSKSYYINVSQPPIQSSEGEDGIRLALSVNAVIHVIPNNVESQLVVSKVHKLTSTSLELTLINEGNKYAHISDMNIGVYDQRKEALRLTREDIKRLGYDAFLAPGVTKNIKIDLGNAINGERIDVRLTTE